MGLSMTSARMLRFFAISSRSPVRLPKALEKSMVPAAAGRSSGEETGSAAEACGLAGSVVGVGSGFLLQAARNANATKGDATTSTRRGAVRIMGIRLLL